MDIQFRPLCTLKYTFLTPCKNTCKASHQHYTRMIKAPFISFTFSSSFCHTLFSTRLFHTMNESIIKCCCLDVCVSLCVCLSLLRGNWTKKLCVGRRRRLETSGRVERIQSAPSVYFEQRPASKKRMEGQRRRQRPVKKKKANGASIEKWKPDTDLL